METALQAAAAGGHLEIVERFLAANADVNAPAGANDGRTALQAAAKGGYLKVVERLLAANAGVNTPAGDYGRIAIQAAAAGGHFKVVERLIGKIFWNSYISDQLNEQPAPSVVCQIYATSLIYWKHIEGLGDHHKPNVAYASTLGAAACMIGAKYPHPLALINSHKIFLRGSLAHGIPPRIPSDSDNVPLPTMENLNSQEVVTPESLQLASCHTNLCRLTGILGNVIYWVHGRHDSVNTGGEKVKTGPG